jgi:hypothetical protein
VASESLVASAGVRVGVVAAIVVTVSVLGVCHGTGFDIGE